MVFFQYWSFRMWIWLSLCPICEVSFSPYTLKEHSVINDLLPILVQLLTLNITLHRFTEYEFKVELGLGENSLFVIL